jgi:hypothetical protein
LDWRDPWVALEPLSEEIAWSMMAQQSERWEDWFEG